MQRRLHNSIIFILINYVNTTKIQNKLTLSLVLLSYYYNFGNKRKCEKEFLVIIFYFSVSFILNNPRVFARVYAIKTPDL